MKYVKKIAIIYGVFLLQSLIFEKINIFSVTLNIMPAVLIIIALYSNPTESALLGAFSGLLTDVVCSRVFGVHIVIYMLLAGLVSNFINKNNNNSPLIMGGVCFTYTAVYIVVYSLIPTVFGYSLNVGGIASDVIVNGILAFIIGLLITYFITVRSKRLEEKAVESDE
ncbi:MAG: rod shape-determining protein MreD [Clostridia bacterium]|nr:rod shape-determining protein MreD [Clostridia bacterium]